MGINYFSEKQLEELSRNPYVKKVSEKAISYSEEFKQLFINSLNSGKGPTEIFHEAGFDTKVLGKRRITNFTLRIKNQSKRLEGFTDLRTLNSGPPRMKEKTPEEKIAYLEHKLALRDQQIDALKKMRFIEREAQWQSQTSHNKNSNKSKI